MPTKSDRAAAADALHQAFSESEAESQLYEEGFDSEYSSSALSRSCSSSSSDDESLPQTSEAIFEALRQLYLERYFNSQGEINKDGTQLRLLLHDYNSTNLRSFIPISDLTPPF